MTGGTYDAATTTVDKSTVCSVYTRTWQQLKDELAQVNPDAIGGASTAWYSAAGDLGDLANRLMTQAGTPLAEAWKGEASTKAQEQLQLAQATARALANVCMQMAHAMDYSSQVATWYKTHAPEPSGTQEGVVTGVSALSPALGQVVDAKLNTALDDAAGQHLTNFMQRYREVLTDALPPEVQEKLLVPSAPAEVPVSQWVAPGTGGTGAPTIPGGGSAPGPTRVDAPGGGPHALDPNSLSNGSTSGAPDGAGGSGAPGGGGGVTAGVGPGGVGSGGVGSGGVGSVAGGGVDPYGASSQLAGGGTAGGIGSTLAGPGAVGGVGGGIGSGLGSSGLGSSGLGSSGLGTGIAGLGGGIAGPALGGPGTTGLRGGGLGGIGRGGLGAGLGRAGVGAPGSGLVGGPLAGGLAAEEQGALGAAGARGGAAGQGRGGASPMMGGQGTGQQEEQRERSTWLTEDDDVWGGDGQVAPPLITG